MKRTLLATVALTCLGLASARPAHAIACTNCTQETTEVFREMKRGVEVAKQLTVLRDQYRQLQATYETLSHPNAVLDIGRDLLNEQMRSPGTAPTAIPGLAFGSRAARNADRFLDQNRLYAPDGDDFAAQEMRRRAQVTANLQAEALAGMERAQDRMAGLDELQASIEAQPDVTALAAVQARMASEQLFLQNEAANVGRLQLMQQTAARVDQDRAEQAGRRDAEEWRGRSMQAFERAW